MGMVPSALLTAKLIELERPRFIAVTGICAGIKGKVNFGDVVFGDPIWDWQSGKYTSGKSAPRFAMAPDGHPLAGAIRAHAEQMRSDAALWANIRSEWPSPPEVALKGVIGPMASGSSVLADPDVVEKIVGQNRNVLAIEMEAYGAISAADFAGHPRPTAFAAKAICDFADGEKSDLWQAYAAYTSAQAIRFFFERYMPSIVDLAGNR